MKYMRSFLISLGILLAVAVSAMADVNLHAVSVTVMPGETAGIAVILDGNPGLAGWKIECRWDSNVLTLTDSTRGDTFANGMYAANSKTADSFTAIWANSAASADNGVLAVLHFAVSDSAKNGTYPIELTYSKASTVDADGTRVPMTVENGMITVQGASEEPQTEETEKKHVSASTPTAQADDSEQENVEDADKTAETTDTADEEQTEPQPSDEASEEETVRTLRFTDVSEDDYFFDAVYWALGGGITSGISDTLFAPQSSCTRGQIVTFLWRAAEKPHPKTKDSGFADVDSGAYYAEAVAWAKENGITSGISDTQFAPDSEVTRAQAVTFLFRAAQGTAAKQPSRFSDVPDDAYYAIAVGWAAENGVTSGVSDTQFAPDMLCTRGQIVTFLYRADGK